MLGLSGEVTRIFLRYVIGPWVVTSGLSIDVHDPDIFAVANFVVGGILALVTEGWWILARKKGWGQ